MTPADALAGRMGDLGAALATTCLGCEHCCCAKHPPRAAVVTLPATPPTCMFCELATLRERCEHLETMIRRKIPADPIHGADGRCICTGEGWCLFCRWAAESERTAAAEKARGELRFALQFARGTFDAMATNLPSSRKSVSEVARDAAARIRLALGDDRAASGEGDAPADPCQTPEKR